jgi:hypothetical protein
LIILLFRARTAPVFVCAPEGQHNFFFEYTAAHGRNLPRYVAAYAFSKEIYRLKDKLPKVMKHDLGQEAFHSTLQARPQNAVFCSFIANLTLGTHQQPLPLSQIGKRIA